MTEDRDPTRGGGSDSAQAETAAQTAKPAPGAAMDLQQARQIEAAKRAAIARKKQALAKKAMISAKLASERAAAAALAANPKEPAAAIAPTSPAPKAAADGPAMTADPDAPAMPARLRKRHMSILISFVLLVVLPMAVAFWYLSERAVAQYHSTMSFSVRKEQVASSLDIMGGLSQLSGNSSTDTDVLYQFIQSQELIAKMDDDIGLRAIYSAPYDVDPVFALAPGATIEDLIDYWPRMVRIHYDRSTGIIQIRALAFDPQQAREIAQKILDYSTQQINDLSAVAQQDATRYARQELDQAIARLTEARQALTDFRLRTQIVDPFADLQGQMGLLSTLQSELATALINLALLRETAAANDPRITQAERMVDLIRAQVTQERAKFGVGGQGPGGEDYASLVSEFERLNVDREFAAEAYKSALAAYDAAVAEAQRQSRYLAAHIRPTLAESSHYPQNWLILGIMQAFLLVFWAVAILIYYSIRDRR